MWSKAKEVSSRITIVEGDLLTLADQGYFDIIMHGCNCQNTMGAGIAKQIKTNYPEAFFADEQFHKLCKSGMLGFYSYCSVKTINEDLRSKFFIFNLYTQEYGGANFSLTAFEEAILRIDKGFVNKSIGIHWIGCGIGGFKDKELILKILKKCKNNMYYIVNYDK